MTMTYVIVISITWFRYPAIYGNITMNFGQECNRRACVACIMCMQYTAHCDTRHRKLRTVSYHVTTGKNFRVAVIKIARLYIAKLLDQGINYMYFSRNLTRNLLVGNIVFTSSCILDKIKVLILGFCFPEKFILQCKYFCFIFVF